MKDAVNKNAPELALVDKKTLVNPIKRWVDSPRHRVTIKATQEQGQIVGWEMSDYIDRTNKLVVEIKYDVNTT